MSDINFMISAQDCLRLMFSKVLQKQTRENHLRLAFEQSGPCSLGQHTIVSTHPSFRFDAVAAEDAVRHVHQRHVSFGIALCHSFYTSASTIREYSTIKLLKAKAR